MKMLRVVNLLGQQLVRWPYARAKLFSCEELLASAERRTGLTDWGDERIIQGLQVLVDTFNSEVPMHPLGRWFFLRRILMEKLVNRLLLQKDFQRFPEIQRVPLDRPIIITGLPRTGTTLLHRMLAQLPTARTLQLWELRRPSPPPDWRTYAADPRRRRPLVPLAARLALGREPLRAQSIIHALAATEPEECTHLLMNTCTTRYFGMYGWAKQYLDWLGQQDITWTYDDYRRQLQLLTWRCARKHLVLKAPIHLRQLEELNAVFPDAYIIQTHREIKEVLPSACSMLTHFRRFFYHQVSPSEIGQQLLTGLASHLRAAQRFRERHPAARLIDVQYRDLVDDPITTLKRITQACEVQLPASSLAQVGAYLAASERHRMQQHHYELETYGLHPEDIRRVYGAIRPQGLVTEQRDH